MRLTRLPASGATAPAAAALAAVLLLACARIEPPPGGPPDVAAPQLVAVFPEDSLAVLTDFDDEVEFRFDEVISEGSSPNVGAGTGDLERLVLLSPSDNVPEVVWRRNRIAVRPREGWRDNIVYRVELLPGVVDLRQNRYTGEPAVVTFSTGAPSPSASLAGSVVDWATGRPAAGALVEAVLVRDSLVYRAIADSSGSFRIGPLPSGAYVVYGVLDANRNRRRDPREAYAVAELAPDSADAGPLYAFVRDTTPPRGRTASVVDSVRAAVSASQPLLPGQQIPQARVRVLLLPDSTPVAVAEAALRQPDTTRAADTAQSGRRRPPLTDQIVVRVESAWTPGARYVIIADSVRNVTGTPGELRAVLDVPAARERAPADSTPADGTPADSAPPPPSE